MAADDVVMLKVNSHGSAAAATNTDMLRA